MKNNDLMFIPTAIQTDINAAEKKILKLRKEISVENDRIEQALKGVLSAARKKYIGKCFKGREYADRRCYLKILDVDHINVSGSIFVRCVRVDVYAQTNIIKNYSYNAMETTYVHVLESEYVYVRPSEFRAQLKAFAKAVMNL